MGHWNELRKLAARHLPASYDELQTIGRRDGFFDGYEEKSYRTAAASLNIRRVMYVDEYNAGYKVGRALKATGTVE